MNIWQSIKNFLGFAPKTQGYGIVRVGSPPSFWQSMGRVLFSSRDATTRSDGWENQYTGASIRGQDKIVHGIFEYEPLNTAQLEELYYGHDVARRVVDGLVFDSTREGYTVVLPDADPDVIKQLTDRATALKVDLRVHEALKWSRLYGGAGLLLGLQDFKPLVQEADPEQKCEFTYVRPVDKRYAYSVFWNENPQSPDYGDPAIFMVGSYTGPTTYVHSSRFIALKGVSTDQVTKRRLQGWGFPILQNVYDVLRGLGQAEHAAIQVMVDMNLDVFKIASLTQAVASGRVDIIAQRQHMVDMQKSTNKSILLDKDGEDFARAGGNIPPGVKDILEHLMYRVAAACDMPVSILWGRDPAGTNATGDPEVTQWNNRVKSYQKEVIKPVLVRIYQCICNDLGIDSDGLDITFSNLSAPSAMESADIAGKEADTHVKLHNIGAVSPNEIRDHLKSKQGGIKLDDDVQADDTLKDPKEEAANELKAKMAMAKTQGGPPGAAKGKKPPFGK